MALLVLIAAAVLAQGSPEIRNLRVSTAVVAQSNAHAPSVVLRSFEKRGRPFRLIVDSQTLATSIVPVAEVRSEPRSWAAVRREIADTAYGRALADAERNESRLQDAGLTHVLPRRPGVDLTVDLCPSRRPLDSQLFTALVDELGREERPVPVAIALTGVWMDEHPSDLAWLLSLTRAGTLAVTWINHSFHHRASASLPLRSNFLLEPGTDIASEVLKTEEAMLSAGITPSVFFRFPGLVSRPELFGKIVSFGLIPVGSDAWLAKNERPREGSIVLVHANGNEPLGVHRFLELLRSERQAIREKSWQLFDLRESVVATEDPR